MTATRFVMSIGFNEDDSKYEGFAYSCLDNKVMPARSDKLTSLINSLSAKIRQHEKELKKFPLPNETSTMVVPDEKKLILPNGG